MRRLQFQLPDELYQRAKALAEEHNIAFSEITTRGMEMYLETFDPAKTMSEDDVPQLVKHPANSGLVDLLQSCPTPFEKPFS